MLNNLFLNASIYRVDPWPRPEKHCAHFKIWVLKYCRVIKKLTIKSRQGGPVNLVQKLYLFRAFEISWFRDYLS